MKNKEELKSWFEDDKLYVGEYVKRKIDRLDEPEEITEEQAYDKTAETFPVTTKEMVSVLEKYYLDMFIEFSEEKIGVLKQIAEKVRNGGIVSKQEEVDRAYKDGYEKGREHGFYKGYREGLGYRGSEPEVLSQVFPVIPKFVADWIEETKPYNSLRVAFEYIAQRKRGNHDDELAFWVEEGNSEIFARAWLDGFTVEEEPKYVIDTDDIEISDGNHYLTNLTLSKDSVKLPIVGDKFDAIRFDDINQAEAIASYVCGRVEELEE